MHCALVMRVDESTAERQREGGARCFSLVSTVSYRCCQLLMCSSSWLAASAAVDRALLDRGSFNT